MFLLPRPRSGTQEELQLLQKSFSVCIIVRCLFNSPQVSSLQAGGGSDPPEREDTSNLLSECSVCVFLLSVDVQGGCSVQMYECPSLTADEAALKRLCWIPFDIKTVSIEAKGGVLRLEPTSDDIQVAKEDTIFVEVPPDAVSTSADVKMRYAIIPSGPFTLPEGYQFGSPVVYIYYDGRRVTKPLALHLPHWYGGEDHARDGLTFAVAPHSLQGRSVYHFQLLAGGKFPVNSRYGVVEIGGHCSLFTTAFESGATVNCQAFSLVKENEEETECKAECNIAVTNAVYCWRRVRLYRNVIGSASYLQSKDIFCVCMCVPYRSCLRIDLVGKYHCLIPSNSSQTGSLPH